MRALNRWIGAHEPRREEITELFAVLLGATVAFVVVGRRHPGREPGVDGARRVRGAREVPVWRGRRQGREPRPGQPHDLPARIGLGADGRFADQVGGLLFGGSFA